MIPLLSPQENYQTHHGFLLMQIYFFLQNIKKKHKRKLTEKKKYCPY